MTIFKLFKLYRYQKLVQLDLWRLAFFRLLHLQIVLHGEDAGHAVCADESVVLLCLSPDHTFKIHMTVFYDNANRRYGLDRIGRQTRISEYSAGDLVTDAIVVE